jgi:putative NADH-flavin reductase
MQIGDLSPLLADQDAIISCLGQRSAADANLMRDSALAVAKALARVKVRRYVVISQGLLFKSRNPLISLLRILLARHLKDSAAMERVLVQSEVQWTIVRPPRLTEGRRFKGYRAEINTRPTGAWSMRRTDLAAFLVDEAERGAYQRRIVGVTSA